MMTSIHCATFVALWLLMYFSLNKLCIQTTASVCACVSTYDTGPVIVSLKATLGFPITQGQLYSRSIL